MSIARPLTGLFLALPMVLLPIANNPARAAPAGAVYEVVTVEEAPDDEGSGGATADESYDPPEIVEQWDNPVPKPRGEAMFRATLLGDHNRARAAVAVSPLVWDAGLAAEAAGYAATLAASRTFAHSKRVPGKPVEGENLWMGTRRAYSYADMVGSWVDERRDFTRGLFPHVSATKSWHEVGHYTQIIWAGTKAVGCAVAANADDEYLVCRYFPAGNVMGRDALVP